MSRKKPEYYEAGVYLIRNLANGAAYVGASIRLTGRIEYRLKIIREGATYGVDERFAKGFEGCAASDVEVRILERVQVPTTEVAKRSWRRRVPKEHQPGLAALREREIFWIKKLRPSLNRNHLRDYIDISKLPVGAPEELIAK